MKKWFGFTQGGVVVPLGEHETIDEADTKETGGAHCTWIWNEESIYELDQPTEGKTDGVDEKYVRNIINQVEAKT